MSGVLLLERRRMGRVLAGGLCAALLGLWVINQFLSLLDPKPRFIAYWTVMPRAAPWIFLRWMLDLAFYTATLVILSTRGQPRAPQEPTALTEVFR